VIHPQPGDLVVWQGHMGIVVSPTQHVFYSAMRSGPGTDTYDAPYWKHRGRVRFYRYINDSGTKSGIDWYSQIRTNRRSCGYVMVLITMCASACRLHCNLAYPMDRYRSDPRYINLLKRMGLL